jgi:hypothetical protein
MGQVGSVELQMTNGGWGGDLVIADNGDIALAIDSLSNPLATQQRLIRLILTNPGDCLQFPWYGSGIRESIGAMITQALLASFKARITQALGTDPGIVANPAPVVPVTTDNVASVFIDVSVTLQTGLALAIPTIVFNLSTGAVSVGESS